MEFIKKVMNDPKEVTKYHIWISIFFVFYYIIAVNGNLYSSLLYLTDAIIFSAYFIYLKTDSGKKNFITANKIISYIMIFTVIILSLMLLVNLVSSNGIGAYYSASQLLMSLISQTINIGFCLYWIYVFYVSSEKNKKVFKYTTTNSNIFTTFIISTISINIITYLTYLDSDILFRLVLKNLISDGIILILFILRLRYIYLFQKHKEERKLK